ncbi:MAG: DUF1801 domain-containing protein [Fimbriimonadaceae bacterium]|nr:DUF1801 domain-containing protein [Fimbriimonadaceae bacterium]
MGTRDESVDAFLSGLKHPLKSEIVALRELIHAARSDITENVKWNAPSFCIDGDDRLTMNFHKKDQVLLVFHRGVKKKDSAFSFEDASGLMRWAGTDRATLGIHSVDEVNEKRLILTDLVVRWFDATRE